MAKNLVIVESPAKGPTIKRFLGKEYLIKASMGHIRDLPEKSLGIDIKNNYEPEYRVSSDKHKIIKELKSEVSKAENIFLATDEDREGEAISWHLQQALQLPEEKTQRIVFHEITEDAIKRALENPRSINYDLVNAQQARRVLDRLVGFELSPLLWRKVMPRLSAGRVQSVAVRLIVDKEEEIKDFTPEEFFKLRAIFDIEGKEMIAESSSNLKNQSSAEKFLNSCIGAEYEVSKIDTKPSKRRPAPPFTTSTLQQEASRKLGFTVAKTMMVAQQLYESGNITYMRTDSVHLSQLAISTTKEEVIKSYGEKYYKRRQFSTKSKGAQEAHEAIRPTYISTSQVEGTKDQQRLYDLIRKRTMATQMADAELEKTVVTIAVSTRRERLVAKAEILKFDGFLKAYDNSSKEKGEAVLLPKLVCGQKLDLKYMDALQKYTQYPARYNEAMLVRKLEELGIGRPSTYAPIISTIQKRKYVEKQSKPALERKLTCLHLQNDEISESIINENYYAQKNKLFPTDIGMIVNKFLVMHFTDVLDYNFTASVEQEFDKIADGNKDWHQMIAEFYVPFHDQVEKTGKEAQRFKGLRKLGEDPNSGKSVFACLGKFGPMIQIGEADDEDKPKFASIRKNQSLETITLQEALKLFEYPRDLGEYEDESVFVTIGRYGPYIKHGKSNYSLAKGTDLENIELETAIQLIEDQKEKKKKKVITAFKEDENMMVLNGRYGPYISYKKKNYRIPKNLTPEDLSFADCQKIIEESASKPKRKRKKS